MTSRRAATSAPSKKTRSAQSTRSATRTRSAQSTRSAKKTRSPQSTRSATKTRSARSTRSSTTATRAPARKPAARGRKQSRRRRFSLGDRLYVIVFVGVIAALVAMAVGPLQNYTAAADRVDGLTQTRDVLREEVDRLEERRERLHDPEEIELMARTNLGMVKPGEVPFVVVTPEPELDRVHPDGADDTPSGPGPWYRRVGRWLGDLIT